MRHAQDDEWEDDPEAPDEADQDDGDEPLGYEKCGQCAKAVWEEAEWCPHCGAIRTAPERKEWPIWVWAGVAMAMGVAVVWAVWGG
jgi:hypothetical protein